MSRIAPLGAPYAPDIQQQFDRIMRGAPPLMLFRVMAGHVRAWEKFRDGSLLDRGPLSLREREIVIDRTCALSRCEYEWGVHIAFFAERAGLDDAMQRSLVLGSGEDLCWSSAERAIIRACDELHATADLTDEAWDGLRAHLTEMAAVEIVMLAGFYRTVSYLTNSLRLPSESFAKRFPL